MKNLFTVALLTITIFSVKAQFMVTASNDTAICPGSSVQLKAVITGGFPPFFYMWLPSTGLSCTNCLNPIATPSSTTSYTVGVQDAMGIPAFDSVTITVNPSLFPTAKYVYQLPGPNIVNFTDSSLIADNWKWDFGDGDSSFLQNPSHTFPSDGFYLVCLIASNNCGSDTICDSVTVMFTNIRTLYIGDGIMITPNPLHSSARIEILDASLISEMINDKITFTLYNALGRKVKHMELGKRIVELQRDELPAGIYLYHVRNSNNLIESGKLVVF